MSDQSIIELVPEEDLSSQSEKTSKRKRTTSLGVSFHSGVADGWVYGVPPVFREAMDICYLRYVDKEKTKLFRKEKGRTKDDSGQLYTIFKNEWTLGIPPARSFSVGDTFYRPAHIHKLVWSDALKEITHSAQVLNAQADRQDDGRGGWVEFEICKYESGVVIDRKRYKALQGVFEGFLKNGRETDLLNIDG